jgi:thioredoxin reductase
MATFTDTHTLDHDVIVIGGGPAGLQAALTLGRVHRRALLLDSGSYRNDPATHMHNFLTHDGTPPAELRAAAQKELAGYDTVSTRSAVVTTVRSLPSGGFAVELGDEVLTTRGIVLATGVRDTLPDKPGLAEIFGTVAAHCPFCHGHEFAGRHVAFLGAGPRVVHLAGLVGPIASRITVLADGEDAADVPPGLGVRAEQVTAFHTTPDGARVSFESGPDEEFGGVFVSTELSQAAPFAAQLGLERLPSGCVEVDVMGRTSLPGVHAAGDMAHVAALPMPMASVLTAAASGQVAAASLAAHLIEA